MSKTATRTEYRAPRAFREPKSGVYLSGIITPREAKAVGASRLDDLASEGRLTKTTVDAGTGAPIAPGLGASRTAAATAARLARGSKKKSTRRGARAASDDTATGAASTD